MRPASWSPEAWPPTANCASIFLRRAENAALPVIFPSLELSTDNAAMIAAAAWPKFVAGDVATAILTAEPSLPLG